jgi:hypothetical protein
VRVTKVTPAASPSTHPNKRNSHLRRSMPTKLEKLNSGSGPGAAGEGRSYVKTVLSALPDEAMTIVYLEELGLGAFNYQLNSLGNSCPGAKAISVIVTSNHGGYPLGGFGPVRLGWVVWFVVIQMPDASALVFRRCFGLGELAATMH